MGPNLSAGTEMFPTLKADGRGGGEIVALPRKKCWQGIQIPEYYTDKKSYRSRGGVHWSSRPPFRYEPVTNVPIQSDASAQEISLHGLVLGDKRAVVFYIGLYPKYVILIGSEGIWTMEWSNWLGQVVCGEEAQEEHDQSSWMPWKGEGNQVGYQPRETIISYQEVMPPNKQVEVSSEQQCGRGSRSSQFGPPPPLWNKLAI